ncbi:DUF2262 domain-containing protein [Enterocloster sp.]|mgnify:FL=1|jgi:hypothetical protein|uniref:DUF2262 domain-containing protein n=1 Tax=Enterocloster sp. TaxID=2719315 RepID=UPI002579EECC|nr:DUF2262 domain-containing protein [Enterocloster sp.]MBS5404691.1 DUF2262 domain-containing protein [Enterocloster sp.]
MFEAFYEKYAPEEQEVVALIRNCIGGGYNNKGDFWEMTAISLGMVFCATGENNIREGRLEWPVTEEERNSEEGWGRFGKEQICRIRVRKLLDEYVPNHTTPEKFNSWAVTGVLEPSVSCPELETVLKEYNKPVVIEDKVLGTLTLKREFDMFETDFSWNGKEVSLMLEVNPESKSSWSRARTAAKKLVSEREAWDKAMREFAAKKLTELANEWLAEDEENKAAEPITEETFAKRITLSELTITSGGGFTAYYNDDAMFWGHAVEVSGSLKKGITYTNLAG